MTAPDAATAVVDPILSWIPSHSAGLGFEVDLMGASHEFPDDRAGESFASGSPVSGRRGGVRWTQTKMRSAGKSPGGNSTT